MLRGILDTHPDAAAARINLAADLMRENRSAEALALLDRPPPEDAETAQHWRLQQILALIRLNRAGEARVLTDTLGPVPPALQPLLEWRQALSALADRDAATATEHARRMEAALEAMPSMLPEHRIMGHYDLAKFWSLLQSPDRAIRHWTEGHRLLSRFQPFSREAYRAFVDASIAAFDAACLAPSRAAANRDGTPVFVIGMPRSGTTLIEQILHAHADVHGAGERSELGMVFSELGGAAETPGAVRRIASLDSRSLDPVADRYLAALHALAPAAHRIVDKMPGNFRYLGLVARLLPNARIIACERDPRDIGFSIFTFRFFGAHPYAHDLSDLGWYIGQHDRLMAHWRRVLPNPILTVRLQDWVDDFNATLHRTLNFLDLPYDPACEHFHEVERRVRTVSREQVRQPIHARGIGRWREYEQSLAPLIAALREENVLKDT
ncbi:MAG TPA: sulfotransferase [Rhodopila sp.]|nr:sulfotransferase [Rhodopila sp.]HVY17006.1 sulfotransferase [Rhodopila sp.]